MLSRTPGKYNAAAGRAMRAPLAAVDANINNASADPTSSSRTPFKSKRNDNTNSTVKKKKKKLMETRTGEVISSIKKKRRRTKSITKTRRDNNCEICTTSSPFVNDNSVPVQFKPFHATTIDPEDETHLHSRTIPINESFHIYESDGDETFESCADERIEAKTKNCVDGYQSSTMSTKPSTTTYSAKQWEDKQCSTFASWLNKLFYPEDNYSVHTISDEEMSAEWNSAKELFESSNMHSIRNAVEREVKEGRLAIVPPRNDRFILDEVYVQEQLTNLLLSYTPRWLQLGLGIVLASSNGGRGIQVRQQ